MLVENLQAKQRAFVFGLHQGLNKAQAARLAGYATPEVAAYKAFKSPAVQAALAELRERDKSDLMLDRRAVLNGLLDSVSMAANSMEMTAAWREIGRVIGAYEPEKVEVTHEVGERTMQQLQQMRTSDLAQLVYDNSKEAEAIEGDFEILEDPAQDE
ncbi:MAG: terminase small subunit [Mycobacterium sp.]